MNLRSNGRIPVDKLPLAGDGIAGRLDFTKSYLFTEVIAK